MKPRERLGSGPRRWVGAVVVGLGLIVALLPFVSAWRLGGEALAQLPEVPGHAASSESRGVGALFDDDFVVATRTYPGVDADTVRAAFTAAGFGSTSVAGARWLAAECCGDYDAVLVRLEERGGSAVAIMTAADRDVQTVWPLLTAFGLIWVLGGATLATRSGRTTVSDER